MAELCAFLDCNMRNLKRSGMARAIWGIAGAAGLVGLGCSNPPPADFGETGGTGSSGSGHSAGGSGQPGAGGGSSGGNVGAGGSSSGGAQGGEQSAGGASQGGSVSSGGTSSSGGAAGSGPQPTGPYKGVGLNDVGRPNGDECTDLDSVGPSWFYNWAAGSPCEGNHDAEYVPIILRWWEQHDWVPSPSEVAQDGRTIILGFNEPDRGEQANLSVSQVLDIWPEFQIDGIRLGSPATASDPNGKAWFESFMAGVAERGLRVDFIAIHWYGWNGGCDTIDSFAGHVDWAEQWGKPIWITEFSCYGQSEPVTRNFHAMAIDFLENHPLVERYAWFRTYWNDPGFQNAALVQNNGTPTELGQDYAARPRFR